MWAVLLAVLLLGPALGPGYLLSYDLVWVPHLAMRSDFLGFGTALPRAVPSDAVIAVLDNVVPAQVLEKLALLLPLVAAGIGASRLVGGSTTARLTAVTLAIWNPFTAERLGIGHWTVLVGYGVLPWLVLAGRETRSSGRMPARTWALTAVGGLSASAGVVSALGLLVSGWSSPRRLARADLTLLSCAVLGNAPWLAAGLLHAGDATGGGASVFALHPEGHLPAPLAALGLGGIWNAQVVPGSRTTFLAWISLLLLLGLGAAGVRTWRRQPDAGRLQVLWGLGFGIALLTWLLPGATEWWAGHVPGGGLVRDGTRTLGLCLPVYAGLPSVGVEVLADRVGHGDAEVRRLVAAAGALLPVILLYDIAWGLSGDLRSAHFPGSWAAARSAGGVSGGDLLVLPLTAYRAPEWNHGRPVLDPLGRYLAADYVAGDALLVDGREVPGEDPRVRGAGRALALPSPAGRTRALLDLGIQAVAVERDAGRPATPELDATVVADGPDLLVERLRGDARPRRVPTWHRIVVGTAWTAYGAVLIGGLLAWVIGAARRLPRNAR
jgi:hypothetical protein